MNNINLNMHKFIDANTFEVISDENVIEVDPDIALAILYLIRKDILLKLVVVGMLSIILIQNKFVIFLC